MREILPRNNYLRKNVFCFLFKPVLNKTHDRLKHFTTAISMIDARIKDSAYLLASKFAYTSRRVDISRQGNVKESKGRLSLAFI